MRLKTRGGKLVVGGGSVGFGIADTAVGQVRNLNWDVEARLSVVDSKGRIVRVVDKKRRGIHSVKSNAIQDFLFPLPDIRRFYRLDISFSAIGSGRVMGAFSNYVRVVPEFFDARLLAPATGVHQGQTLPLRLSNFGTQTISSRSYDWQFAVEFFDGQSWVPAPSSPPSMKHILNIQKLLAGQMAKCMLVHVSADEAEGLYRASVTVNRSGESVARLETEFEVSGRTLKQRLSQALGMSVSTRKSVNSWPESGLVASVPGSQVKNQNNCVGCMHDVAVIERWTQNYSPTSYAGLYFKGRHRLWLVVGYTEDQAAHVRSIKELPGLINPQRVVAFPYVPEHSLSALVDLAQDIVDNWSKGAYSSVDSVAVDVVENRVDIGTRHVKRAKATLKRLYGSAAPIYVHYEEAPVEL